jgi:hypothetical protein
VRNALSHGAGGFLPGERDEKNEKASAGVRKSDRWELISIVIRD